MKVNKESEKMSLKLHIQALPTKVHLVKAMVFPVVMCGCASWTLKKAEHRRIDAFELWCWRRLLRVLWTARSYQSILNQPWIFIGRTEAEAEAPIHWPPDAKRQVTGEDSDAVKDWGLEEKRVTEADMVGCCHWVWANSGRQWRTEKPGVLRSMGLQRVRHDSVTEQQKPTQELVLEPPSKWLPPRGTREVLD